MKKQVVIAFLMLCAIVSLSAADYIIGTSTSNQNYVPLYGYNDYGWSKFLFSASEMQAAGFTTTQDITRISFYVHNALEDYITEDQRVYMRYFYDSSYSSTSLAYPGTSSFTNVYTGTVNWAGPGWVEIVFSNPFSYNPSWGLEILWENRDGSKLAGPPKFRTTSSGSNYTAVYKYANNSFPTTNGTRSRDHRPNIRFSTPTLEPPSPAIPLHPVDAAEDIAINSKLSWNHTGGSPTGYRLWLGTDNPPSNLVAAYYTTATNYTPSAYLAYDTQYYWRVVPVNENGPAFDCPIWSFRTMADPSIASFPHLESFDAAFPPSGWSHHSGTLDNPQGMGAANSSQWQQANWLNIPSEDKAARINTWGPVSGYLISPLFNVPDDDYILEFDAALLRSGQSPDGTPPNYNNSDDQFAILIGDGFSWSTANIVREYNNSGSEYILNSIQTTGTHISIPLAGYSGHIKIAIFAGSQIMNDDNDFMINNFRIGLPQQEISAPDLSIALDPVSNLPRLNWQAIPGANIYHIYQAESPYGVFAPIGDTSNTSYPINSNQSKLFFKITAE